MSGWVLPSPACATTAIVTSLLGGDLLDARHERRQRGQRHADVLEQQRAEPLHRREGGPPGRRERLALVRVVGA